MKKISLLTITLLAFTLKAADDLPQEILDQIAAEQALAEMEREQRLRSAEEYAVELALAESLAQNQSGAQFYVASPEEIEAENAAWNARATQQPSRHEHRHYQNTYAASAAPANDELTEEEIAQIAALEEMSLAEEIARHAARRAKRTSILGEHGAFVEGRGIKPPIKPKPAIRLKPRPTIQHDSEQAASAPAPNPNPTNGDSVFDELKNRLNKMFG